MGRGVGKRKERIGEGDGDCFDLEMLGEANGWSVWRTWWGYDTRYHGCKFFHSAVYTDVCLVTLGLCRIWLTNGCSRTAQQSMRDSSQLLLRPNATFIILTGLA